MIDMNHQPSDAWSKPLPSVDVSTIDPLIRPLIPYFAELTTERIASLRAHVDAGALDQIKRLAHTIKGSAASYGFPHFAEVALAIEQAIPKPDAQDAIRPLVERLGAMHDELLRTIRTSPELFKEEDESDA